MSLLWKKETRHENALYVDIFRKTSPNMMCMLGSDSDLYFEMAEEMMDSYDRCEKNDDQSIFYRKKGDTEFQQMKWHSAIKSYNRSLCLAKVGSMQMGNAYAKRAQCFFQLKMYEKCLIDLDLARFSNYPSKYFDLLSMREDECLKLMAENAESISFVPSLDFKPNKKYPEMANVLKIERDQTAKWQIAAKKDIRVGQIILVEKSFVSTFTESFQKCCVCSIALTNLVPCNKCARALLCPTCSGSILHKVECDADILFYGQYQGVSDTFRSVLLAMSMFDDADELIEFVEKIVTGDLTKIPTSISNQKTKYRAFLHLANDDSIDLKEDAPLAFIQYAALLSQHTVKQYFSTKHHQRFLMHLVFHHVSVLKFSGLDSSEVGHDNATEDTDYCLLLSMNARHSCAPNVTIKMVDGHAIMITMRPIKKDQPIQLAYNESIILENVDERQRLLKDELGLECQCERCKNESDDMDAINDSRLILDSNYQFIARTLKECQKDRNRKAQPNEWNEMMERAEKFLNMYGHQEWDDYLGSVFLLYYFMIKKKHDRYGSFANLQLNGTAEH